MGESMKVARTDKDGFSTIEFVSVAITLVLIVLVGLSFLSTSSIEPHRASDATNERYLKQVALDDYYHGTWGDRTTMTYYLSYEGQVFRAEPPSGNYDIYRVEILDNSIVVEKQNKRNLLDMIFA